MTAAASSRTTKLALLALFLLAPLAATGGGSQGEGPTLEPLDLDLRVDVRPDEPRLRVEARVTFRARLEGDDVPFALRPEIELDRVSNADGKALQWERRRNRVIVEGGALPAWQPVTWLFSYQLRLSSTLDAAGSFFTTTPWYPYAVRARPRGDFAVYAPTRARVIVRLPPPWTAVSSGRLHLVEGSADRTFTWTQSRPRPIHPLVIGRFRMGERRRDDLLGYTFFSRINAPQAETFIDYVLDVIDYYSEEFGEFDQPTYTLVELPLSNELRGLTQPGLTLLASDDVSADSPFPYRILAHEVAHNWWNFRVALPRRSDYWLREGLPTYSALLFLERVYSAEMMRQELERTRRVALAPQRPRPLASGFNTDDPEALYALNYHKAAFVFHMLRMVMGREAFVGLLHDLVRLHADGTADADDFRRLAEVRYGDDLGWFFDSWVASELVPTFRVIYSVKPEDGATVPVYWINGSVEQFGARVRGPVMLRVVLQNAPALEHEVWLQPGTTEFTIACPTPPLEVQFDPGRNLLYDAVDVVRTG